MACNRRAFSAKFGRSTENDAERIGYKDDKACCRGPAQMMTTLNDGRTSTGSACGSVNIAEKISLATTSLKTLDVSFVKATPRASGEAVFRKDPDEQTDHVGISGKTKPIQRIKVEKCFTIRLDDQEHEEDDEQESMGSWEMVEAESTPSDPCLGEKYTLV